MIYKIITLFISAIMPLSALGGATKKEIAVINYCVSKYGKGVKWEPSKIIKLDLRGENKCDYAMIGIENKEVVVAIILAPLNKKSHTDFTVFPIDPRSEDGICGLPVNLEKELLDFNPDELGMGKMKDFPTNGKSMGLSISGGGCDKIHMYWSQPQRTLLWWRR